MIQLCIYYGLIYDDYFLGYNYFLIEYLFMVNFYKIPSMMLMGFGSHFGSLFLRDWNADFSAFVHSRFKTRFLINLAFTSGMLSKALKFIGFFVSRSLKFLYFFSEGFSKFLALFPDSNRFWKFNYFLISFWIPGVLTNYKRVKFRLDKISKYTNLERYPNGLIFLGESRFLPISSMESRAVKLPSIGLADIDTGISPFSYTVPSNNKAFSISVAYFGLFRHATEMGWVSAYGFYLDKIYRKFDKFISKFFYFFNIRLSIFPKLWRTFQKVSKFTFQKNFSFRYRWLTTLIQLPDITNIYNYEGLQLFRKCDRLVDLYIDLFISARLENSTQFKTKIKLLKTGRYQFRSSRRRRFYGSRILYNSRYNYKKYFRLGLFFFF